MASTSPSAAPVLPWFVQDKVQKWESPSPQYKSWFSVVSTSEPSKTCHLFYSFVCFWRAIAEIARRGLFLAQERSKKKVVALPLPIADLPNVSFANISQILQ